MNDKEREEKALKKLMEDIFNNKEEFLNLGTLQKIIFYCMENYDNWKEMTLKFELDADEETVFEVDIEDFFGDGEIGVVILSNSGGEQPPLDLEKMDFLIHVIQETNPEEWMDMAICCRTDDSVDNKDFPYPNVLETYVDEDDNKLVFKV